MTSVVQRIRGEKERLKQTRILVIADDTAISDMLHRSLADNYTIELAGNGRHALARFNGKPPHLVLLDATLPDMDGLELYKMLLTLKQMQHVPTIFMGYKDAPNTHRLAALELGADDYITKPFDIEEVKLIIKNSLPVQPASADPVTGLPGWLAVESAIQRVLPGNHWSIVLAGITYLEEFREVYGFIQANDLLRTTGYLLQDVVASRGTFYDFVGYMGGGDFLIVTLSQEAPHLVSEIRQQFQQQTRRLYAAADARSGKITLPDGRSTPLMRLACGVVRGQRRPFQSPLEVVETAEQYRKFEME